jgi:hypothetical protein
MTFAPCSHCGEIRTETPDSQRCWTIAHAIANSITQGRTPSEADSHIVELRRWLADHPRQRGTQQYRDREISLDRWIAKADLIRKS